MIISSFLAKPRSERLRKSEKQKLSFWYVPNWPVLKNSKKIAKKLEKLKNTIMASCQAKTSSESSRTSEN